MTDFAMVWSALDDPTRRWLANHNSEVLPAAVVGELLAAAGAVGGTEWLDRDDPDGPVLTDGVVDWIEGAANGE